MKKTRHEGDEGTVSFWLHMKALYKDEEIQGDATTQAFDYSGRGEPPISN